MSRCVFPEMMGLVVIGLVLVDCLGCGGAGGRQAVTGTVSLDGKPLASGSIHFQPAAGLKVPSAGAPIEAGRFFIPADQGLLPGQYQVTILAMQETGRMIDDEQRGKVPELVPVRFREAGSLNATVESGKKAHFDFQLTSVP